MRIKDRLIELGYGKQAEALEGSAIDCIALKTTKSSEHEFSIGESKIGGLPHLPQNYEWPLFNGEPLAFLAQFNLEQTSTYDTQGLLPKTGMLYFFHEGGNSVWGDDPKDKGGFKVFHYDGDMAKLCITASPDSLDEHLRFSPCKLEFSCEKSYVPYEEAVLLFGEESDDSDKFDEFCDLYIDMLGNDASGNQLLGHPFLIQGDIYLESQLVTHGLYCGDPSGFNDPRAKELEQGASEWMLLFQLDSDYNADMMWGDVGMIYFTIKKHDLEIGNFDDAWSVFQCH